MSNLLKKGEDEATFDKPLYTPIKRRSFFMYAGATAGVTALMLAGCKDDTNDNDPSTDTVKLGSGDVGVLNYAYALEQLEAAFYAQVKATPATDFAPAEKAYFSNIASHEAIHRDFFKAAINRDAPGMLIMDLTPDFTKIDFTKRASVLGAAQTFEDLGVAAYNGAGHLLKNTSYLLLAGKIVSVEARHAAYVRDLLYGTDANKFFAGDEQVDPNTGLDKQMDPMSVISAAQGFIKQKIDASQVGK